MGRPKNCLGINRKLLPVKFHYFLFMAALACALPFRTVFAKQLGISATELGVIFCAVPFLRIVTNPLFGFILDYFKKIRLTISVIMIAVAFSLLCLIFIPPKASSGYHRLNITKSDFYTKLKYMCYNETFPLTYTHRLLMYSEYQIINNFAKNKNSFACDMQCSDSSTGINNGKSILQCSSKIRFDLKVFVEASSCEISIRLLKGELVILSDSFQNSVSFNVNDSSVRRFESMVSPFDNCSRETTRLSSFIRKSHRTINKNGQSDVIEAFDNGRAYAFLTAPENVDSGKKIYYVLHEYTIDVPVDDIINNSACSTEFECRTKRCFFEPQKESFNQETFVAEENEFLSLQFWSLFVLIAISSVMFSAIMFMMDAVCYELLKDRRDLYGQQRIFGAIGWGLGALVGGFLNQIVPNEFGETDYTLSFYLLAVLIIIDLLPVYQLKVTDLKYSPHILKDVCFLFTKFDIVYNLIIVYVIGILSGLIWNYQFWFMQEIGSSQILLGLSQTFECLFELPCFIVSGWIIKKIGHEYCNSITLLCFGLRYLCFVFMYNPWWTLAAGLFHGPTFGLFYASMTMYAKNKAPPGTEATVQSLLHLSFEGLGTAIGSILGGVGLDKFGARTSFLYAAEISFFVFFINILVTVLFFRDRKKAKEIEHSASCS